MLNHHITPTMRSQAAVLLSRSAHWSRGSARMENGRLVNVVTFSSSRTTRDKDGKEKNVVYLTRVDGACCSCPGFVARQACSHSLACRIESERARDEIEAPRIDSEHDVLTGWVF